MQFLSNGTDTSLPGLFLLESLLENIFQEVELFTAGFIRTDIKSEELALVLENIGLEHFIQQVWVFGVQIGGSDRIENGFAFVELVVQQLLFRQLDPLCIVYKEAFFCSLHFFLSLSDY